jgi:hypothetical protein
MSLSPAIAFMLQIEATRASIISIIATIHYNALTVRTALRFGETPANFLA